jgi:hypothetical protein
MPDLMPIFDAILAAVEQSPEAAKKVAGLLDDPKAAADAVAEANAAADEQVWADPSNPPQPLHPGVVDSQPSLIGK